MSEKGLGHIMQRFSSNLFLCILLLFISVVLYLAQIIIFQDIRDTGFYFLQDIAFLPLQVAIVTIVLAKIISIREKRERLKKINIAISAFFSEAGREIILRMLLISTISINDLPNLDITTQWTGADFQKSIKSLKSCDIKINCNIDILPEVKILLMEKRGFLLSMFANPNLLEHDTFTDMLWALLHLTDELIARNRMDNLPDSDIQHLAFDINRALSTLLVQWIHHMEHLKTDYPYLFSLELRRNPFNENSNIIVR